MQRCFPDTLRPLDDGGQVLGRFHSLPVLSVLRWRQLARSRALDIRNARALAILGDSVTTDHVSPGGSIGAESPAGLYLQSLSIAPRGFNTYVARRVNHEVMLRGTFANVRLHNRCWACAR